jgi:hypothetical protein
MGVQGGAVAEKEEGGGGLMRLGPFFLDHEFNSDKVKKIKNKIKSMLAQDRYSTESNHKAKQPLLDEDGASYK